jgi:hypothetical protein
VVAARLRAAATRRRRIAWRLAIAGIAALAAFGVWVNGSLALMYQRLYNPPPEAQRADMLRFQYDLADAMGAGTPQVDLASGRNPGPPAPAGTTRIVGGCDALYWSDGEAWRLVEGTPTAGVQRVRLAPPPDDAQWHPVISWGGAATTWAVGARRHGADVEIARGIAGSDGRVAFRGWTSMRWRGEGERTVEVAAVRPSDELRVQVDGADVVVDRLLKGTRAVDPRIGRADAPGVAGTYGAPLRPLPAHTPLCRTLLARR